MNKKINRVIAAALAAVMLAGLLPVMQLTSEAATVKRPSVLVGADGLIDGDTVILGSAVSNSVTYPVEWQVLDADADLLGRSGGTLLVSKYLLPTATADTATGGIDTAASYTNLTMPADTAVLTVTKSDDAYTANLGSNYLSAYGDYDITAAGLLIAEENNALTNAKFFSLSAEELETYIRNSDSTRKAVVRRPYCAAYAVETAGTRSWALRSTSVTGEDCVISPVVNDSEYTPEVGGLVYEAQSGTSYLSRPAFNLRDNAVSFVYNTTVTTRISGDMAIATEQISGFGEQVETLSATTVSGTSTWRVAVETLPMTSASVVYHQDGSLTVTFDEDADGYKIGVLSVNADGDVLNWGTARLTTYGAFDFTPGEDVSTLYFFSFDYDAVTGQMETSSLVEVGVEHTSAMTLGAGQLSDGDTVYFNGNATYVANADAGSTAVSNTHTVSTMTLGADSENQYPVFSENAIFLIGLLGEPGTYGGGLMYADYYLDELTETARISSYSVIEKAVANTRRKIAVEMSNATAAAKGEVGSLHSNQEDAADSTFGTASAEERSLLQSALAYTWTDDESYTPEVYSSAVVINNTATVLAEENAVNGKQLFALSAGEYTALPDSVKTALGNTILRSAITETKGVILTNYGSAMFTFESDAAATYQNQVATGLSTIGGFDADVAVGVNLLRDKVVYMLQTSADVQTLTDDQNVYTVPEYDETCTSWNIAILDESSTFAVVPEIGYVGPTPSFSYVGCRADSYVSVLVTDAAGTVKQYGKVSYISEEESVFDYISTAGLSLEYGDRVYLFNEYTCYDGENPTVYASAPTLVWEQKIDGTVSISPDTFAEGDLLVIDDSDVKYASGNSLNYRWFYNIYGTYDGAGQTWTATKNENKNVITAKVYLGTGGNNCLLATASRDDTVSRLPIYNGETDPDTFTGSTLYFGADGDGDYIWTVIGKPTAGVSAVTDNSNSGYDDDLTPSDALALMRKYAVSAGSASDTVISGYMQNSVLLTDTADAEIANDYLWCDAASAEDQPVFRPSYNDIQKLQTAGYGICAATEGSSATVDYLLRNKDSYNCYATVDALGELQQYSESKVQYTRDSLNVNTNRILFYSPADCDLTYEALEAVRGEDIADWKLTVVDTAYFEGDDITNVTFDESSVTVSGSTDSVNENRYVTAWAINAGQEIVWVDSQACTQSGSFTAEFTLPDGLSDYNIFAVLRIDNGDNRSDVCSEPRTFLPFVIQTEIYINGVRSDSGCDYALLAVNDEYEKGAAFLHDSFRIRVSNIATGYSFDHVSAVSPYADPVEIEMTDGANGYEGTATADHMGIVMRIYLTSTEYAIEAHVFDTNDQRVDGVAATVTAPATACYNDTFQYTITPAYGYAVKEVNVHKYNDDFYDISLITPTNKAAVYTETMGAGKLVIRVTMEQLSTYSLTLGADPDNGGTLTAKLPTGAELSGIVAGESLPLRATPAEGYVLTGITYRVGDGEEQTLTPGEDGYTFIMPEGDAVVTAHFAQDRGITASVYDVSTDTAKAYEAAVTYTVNDEETEVFHAGDLVTAEVSVPNSMAISEIVSATGDVTFTQTGKDTFTFTMPDSDVALTVNLKKIAIKSAYLHVNEDINVVYTVQLPEGFENASAEFTFMGKTYTVTEAVTDTQGRTCFEFTHITPQYMGEGIDVTLTADLNGYTCSCSNTGYSVKKYCTNMLAKTSDTYLTTLLSDTLAYGAAAQTYMDYKTDSLVTDGLNLQTSTFPGLSGYAASFEGTADADTYWKSASLTLGSNVTMVFTFYAKDIENLSVNVTVAGRTKTYTEFYALGDDLYTVTFPGIHAAEYNSAVSASFSRSGAQVGNTLKYSVNTYLCSKQSSEDATLAGLVQALYNYGASALTYYKERIAK